MCKISKPNGSPSQRYPFDGQTNGQTNGRTDECEFIGHQFVNYHRSYIDPARFNVEAVQTKLSGLLLLQIGLVYSVHLCDQKKDWAVNSSRHELFAAQS